MDASEYKHVVLGLIFLKYISDTFDEHHATLIAGKGQYDGANPEDPDEYNRKCVLGSPESTLDASAGTCEATHHREAGR